MARSRNIKPALYKNEDLAECSVWARYIFPGLWMLADCEGKLEDRPKRIKGELLPFDERTVEPLLVELQQRGFIVRYSDRANKYIKILSFTKHQNPHYREQKSVIPDPESLGLCTQSLILKPEALPPIDSTKSPGLECQQVTLIDPKARLIPSSLIPDSLSSDSPIKTKTRQKTQKRPVPEGWKPSESTCKAMATEFRLPEGGIESYLSAFLDICASKGHEYADFDAAFRNCVRKDWPGLRINGHMKGKPKSLLELVDEQPPNAVPQPHNALQDEDIPF